MSIRARGMAAKTAILIVVGIAAFATGAFVVHAATSSSAQTAKKKAKGKAAFRIRTQVTDQLFPGKAVKLKVSLANNRPKPLWVKRLTLKLAIDQAHMNAGCSVARDYRVEQLPKKAFPIKLAKKPKAKKIKKKRKAKIHWKPIKAKRARGKPTLTMLNLPSVNQDACKGATLTISYRSQASLKKPKSKKAAKK
jgi:hypothetical protein